MKPLLMRVFRLTTQDGSWEDLRFGAAFTPSSDIRRLELVDVLVFCRLLESVTVRWLVVGAVGLSYG